MPIIYKITNQVNGKIYIGKTMKDSVKRRFYQHKSSARLNRQSALYKAMRKYGEDKFVIEVLLQINCSEQELNNLEKKFISDNKSCVRNVGYNMTDGGEAFPFNMWNEDMRRKKSLSSLGDKNPMYGRVRSGEDNHSNYKKNVYVYNAVGDLIMIHKGVRSVSKLLGVTHRRVLQSFKDKSFVCGKYLFSETPLTDDFFSSFTPKYFIRKKVYRINKLGRIEKVYNSTYDVISDGFTKKCVSRVCRGLSETHKGYYWSFDQTE